MSLLQLLVDMVDNQALRKAFAKDPTVILEAYQITDPNEISAALAPTDDSIKKAFLNQHYFPPGQGERTVHVTFCGVMKGSGRGGDTDADESTVTKSKARRGNAGKKGAPKKKR